jgi:hypothetical protein
VDDARYGRTPRWKILALGLPIAAAMFLLGGFWTLVSWGVIGDNKGSSPLGTIGSILAGLGVALAWVCLRPRR